MIDEQIEKGWLRDWGESLEIIVYKCKKNNCFHIKEMDVVYKSFQKKSSPKSVSL